MGGIGKLIFREREKLGISQSELCRGICSPASISRLEWGEQNIGEWCIDAFMQRLGKSQDNFWTIVHVGDYNLMEHRREIWDAILLQEYEVAESGIQKYENSINGGKLHKQFLVQCRGMIKRNRDNDWEGALELFTEAILITVSKFAIDNIEHIVIGRNEMFIIMLLAETYAYLGKEEIAQQMLEGILKGIQKKEWDEEELVKIYPKIIRVYVEFLKKEDKYEEVISLSQNALNMLTDNGIIFLLAELMECIIWAMERCIQVEERRFSIREEQEYIQLEKHIKVLNEIWNEYGTFPEKSMLYLTNIQKDISVSNEIIGKCRKLYNLSQEKLSENVCTVEHLSRIENGRCSPIEKNYRGLMEKMNQAQERNRFFINVQEYSLHEKIRQMEKNISGAEYRKAEKEWKKLRKEMPADSLHNQQYIARYDAIIKYYNKKICLKKAIYDYTNALKLTMPDYGNINISNWPLSRNEALLLTNIANGYSMIGKMKEAKKIYYALWDWILQSQVTPICHSIKYKMVCYNMGLQETLDKNFEQAKEVLNGGIRICMQAGRVEMMPRFLYCLGWTIKEEGNREKEKKARHILKQAFYLSNILNLTNICSEICDYYEEVWKDNLQY